MKVPAVVKTVLDVFPLITLPAPSLNDCSQTSQTSQARQTIDELYVYGLDGEGLPFDPLCLFFTCIATLAPEKPVQVTARSRYMTVSQQFPVLYTMSGAVVTSIDDLLQVYFPHLKTDKQLTIYRALVDGWISDAWFYSVLQTDKPTQEKLYGYSEQPAPPFPFKLIISAHLNDHIANKMNNQTSSQTLSTAKLALQTLEDKLSDDDSRALFTIGDLGIGALGAFDLLVFAYIWPILAYLPDSEVAKLVGPRLRRHAFLVHDKIIDLI